MAEIDLSLLFPKGQASPTPSRAIEGARKDGLDGEYLLLNGKTSELVKLLKPGQRLEQLYEQIHGKGKKAYFAFSRLHPGQPSRTIAKDSAGLFHYTEDRTLSIGEYKRIASFPDYYQFIGSFTTALQRIGNSVPPMLTRAIAMQIKHVLFNGEPLIPYPKTMSYLEILESAWLDHLKPKAPGAPTVISLFSGGGGSSLGYSMAGYRELLAVEWDDNAVATFRLNFPEVPVYHGDITKLSVEECLTLAGIAPGELDLLDGSPPCQGFSTAGKRILDDPRNQLFREYVRLLRGLKPKVFLMENVSGMVKGKMKLVFAEIMRELKASGYRVSARLMNAMYFNVPQSRQRMIFIGVREDLGTLPSHPKGESRPVTVREAIGHLVGTYPEEFGRHKPHLYEQWLTGYNPRNGRAGLRVVRPGSYVGSFNSCRLEPDKPAATFVKSHNHWHYSEFRGLQPTEASVLASFGPYYKWNATWVERIGNSVPPLMIKSIAAHIRQEILSK